MLSLKQIFGEGTYFFSWATTNHLHIVKLAPACALGLDLRGYMLSDVKACSVGCRIGGGRVGS